MMMFDQPTEPCCVCNEEITGNHFAECSYCLKAFHLRMTENAPDMKDCGTVQINDETWAMDFICDACFAASTQPAVTT